MTYSNSYEIYDKYIIRTPKYAINSLRNTLQEDKDQILQILCNDNIFLEAVYLASPSLHHAVKKYLENKILPKDSDKLLYSLIKYYSRMCTRCTPFGLFAGTSIGTFRDSNKLLIDNQSDRRHTRLDMHYLYQLTKSLEAQPDILPHLFLYPNNSIYQFGKQLRYIHYIYQNGIRKYGIMSTETSYALNLILRITSLGASFTQVRDLLTREGFSNIDNYLKDLIDSQILYSELEPSITGKDFLFQIVSTLQNRIPGHPIINTLQAIQEKIAKIDASQIGTTIQLHEEIIESMLQVKDFQTTQYLFQSDLSKTFSTNILSDNIKNQLTEAFRILDKITSPQNRSASLGPFIAAFKTRYETEEIPLSKLLDPEIGLLYKTKEYSNNNSLLQNIQLPHKEESPNFSYSDFQILLQKKLQICLHKNEKEIILIEDELGEGFNKYTLPTALNCMCILFYEKDQLKIHTKGATGPSCIDLIARFAHIDPEINAYIHEIARKEDELHAPAILADILHIPEARIGNVMLRPVIRNYEIPYLAKSDLEFSKQINTSDIMISIKGDEFFLRSAKLNKRIIPRLSNAYNYHQNALPLYRFLCDIQDQSNKPFMRFEWGRLEQKATFLPRVTINNIILSLAQWNLTSNDVKDILQNRNSDENLMQATNAFRAKFNIPQIITLTEQDNELFIDLENILYIHIFCNEIKNKQKITLTEYPYTQNGYLVKDESGNFYASQFIFSAYQSK